MVTYFRDGTLRAGPYICTARIASRVAHDPLPCLRMQEHRSGVETEPRALLWKASCRVSSSWTGWITIEEGKDSRQPKPARRSIAEAITRVAPTNIWKPSVPGILRRVSDMDWRCPCRCATTWATHWVAPTNTRLVRNAAISIRVCLVFVGATGRSPLFWENSGRQQNRQSAHTKAQREKAISS